VLSLGKLAPGQQQYYLDTVARGAEEYYTGAREAPGEWIGTAARRLALEGEVDAETLHHVLLGRDPRTGESLTRGQGAPKVPGFDVTFSAPKSVSLLFALGDSEISDQVRAAHDVAVARALAALESEASRARRGKTGVEQVPGDGFVAAAFRHRTSRAGDPQLHTHVVIANLVHAPSDDRWSALDARPLYSWAKTGGYLYEAEVRSELTRRLGVAWTASHHGIADIAGIPERALRAFSRRRQQIEAHLEHVGETTARAAQVAAYATRDAKHIEAVRETMVIEWHERARAEGLDAKALTDVLDRTAAVPAPTAGTDRADALFARLSSPDGLTAEHATFGRREVLQGIAEDLAAGAGITAISTLADEFLTSGHVVLLAQARGLRSSDVIRRRDGTVVATGADQARWTTPEMLAVEASIVRNAADRRDDHVAIATPMCLRTALATRPTLSREQAHLVRRITRSGAGVDIVEGAAGTGKTYALAAARDAWEASGYHVTGCALAARAAAELEQGSGIPSQTIHRMLRRLDDSRNAGPQTGNVLIVDEAAMVGTRTLARLLDHAAIGGAKVVLVGDHHQLPAIDAGGAFAGLARRLGANRLQDNRRQSADWERRALARLRVGATDRALAAYTDHGRIRISPTAGAARERLVDDWQRARREGRAVTMLAAHAADVNELNRLAREQLQSARQIGPDVVTVRGRPFAIGDEILATRNDYKLGVLNGTRASIEHIDPQDAGMDIRTNDGKRVELPPEYVAGGNVTHAYAMTFHKAQGATVGETFVLGTEGLDREHTYSGLSRGTEANWLYLSDATDRADERHAPEIEADATERLAMRLDVSSAKAMAIDLDDDLALGL
jgi:conjugative relaxase-like TrwC/TraI family protein